jgi:hypothetical protein
MQFVRLDLLGKQRKEFGKAESLREVTDTGGRRSPLK